MTGTVLAPSTADYLLALSAPVGLAGARVPQTSAVDFMQLLSGVAAHCTASLALQRLSNFPHLRDALEPPLRAAQARNVALAFTSVADLTAVGTALNAASIAWCVLKGVPLSMRHYKDLAARRVGDIDLLVAPEQVHVAHDALLRAGCRRAHGDPHDALPPPRYWHEQPYITAGGLSLELHHRLHPNPKLLETTTAELVAKVEHVNIGRLAVPVLDSVTELLYLCTHGSRHAWFRLLWICDVAVIVSRGSEEFLAEARRVATRQDLQFPLAEGMLLAETLLGAPHIDWAHRLLRRSARLRYLLKHAEESLWSARDALGNPVGRSHSSLVAALCQRSGVRFWAWELGLRARHELKRWGALPT